MRQVEVFFIGILLIWFIASGRAKKVQTAVI